MNITARKHYCKTFTLIDILVRPVLVCARVYKGRNGIAHEAIVFVWVVSSSLWDFKVVKKQWAGALLSVKCCCSG